MRTAVDLYRGEFCAENYYPWAEGMQERLRASFVQACARLADLLAEGGAREDALSTLDRAIEADPLSDDLTRRAMTLDDELGRRSAALSRFRKLETTLETELDVEPDPETQSLARQLREKESTPARR